MFDSIYGQLIFLVPAIIALTDLVKKSLEVRGIYVPSDVTIAIACAWGLVLSVGWWYYPTYPEPVQVAVAGIAVALVAAGVVKTVDYATN